MTWFVNDVVTLEAVFTNPAGALFNPSTVVFKVRTPAGTVSTLGTPSNPSTGVYTIAYTPATEGEYVWWATGTGSDAKSAKGKFLVSDSVP